MIQDFFPKPFERQIRGQFGDTEWDLLEAALQTPTPVSIRLNPAKTPLDPSLLPPSDGAINWHPDGYYLKERPVFTLDPLFHAGAYYVQEASSMFVYEVLKQANRLNKPLKVLDMCAAPGGKTTLLNDAVQGILTANEIVPARAAVLRENLEKWGISNAAVTSTDVAAFENLPEWFDIILIDAPCSGEGMFRKDPIAVKEWSLDNVQLCTTRQSQILEIAKKALAPGGLLIYSTCTFNRSENEDQMKQHFSTANYRAIPLQNTENQGILTCDIGYRFMPHHTKGEGFYIAAFEKIDTEQRPLKLSHGERFIHITALPKRFKPMIAPWLKDADSLSFYQTHSGDVLALPTAREEELLLFDKHIKSKWFGCFIGALKGEDLIPAHSLALSNMVASAINRVELDREQALTFLKKETFDLPSNTPKGWAMATYSGLALGWIKVLPNRMNNYLPPERRIRMEVR
jgi:16S rRNA C967 or C1407 C5-methylase (RsmB/RsmF family)/NOL1/NOP2/fmu family ribosome biogenesis protein